MLSLSGALAIRKRLMNESTGIKDFSMPLRAE
jgi:hypothetical protein